MTNSHPIHTLQAHIINTALVCQCPALYAHHVQLMFHWHALDCTEPDSVCVWQVYEAASKALYEARLAVWGYVESGRLYQEIEGRLRAS